MPPSLPKRCPRLLKIRPFFRSKSPSSDALISVISLSILFLLFFHFFCSDLGFFHHTFAPNDSPQWLPTILPHPDPSLLRSEPIVDQKLVIESSKQVKSSAWSVSNYSSIVEETLPSEIAIGNGSPDVNGKDIGAEGVLLGRSSTKKVKKPARGQGSKPRPFQKAMAMAWKAGKQVLQELESLSNSTNFVPSKRNLPCPKSIFMTEQEFKETHNFMKLPCGMSVGSSVTLIGVPRPPHFETKPSIGHIADGAPVSTEVSQFMFELHAAKESDNEYASKILHINPRLKGDWSDKPVIELNKFVKGQWGTSQRCDGTPSSFYETVEGLPKCEKWHENIDNGKEPSWWLNRLIEKIEKPDLSWKYPFSQNRSFIMTIRAGLEGYHMSVDGKHVASFPYSTGLLEDAIDGSFVGGDVDVQAIIATSLPSIPPKSLDEKIFENWKLWRAPTLPDASIDLFIGVLSAADHFAERLAIRSAWFQAEQIKTGKVAARFFIALHPDKNVNLQMKKEAEYYGDMVILPFLDDYSLVVLKTLAICKYGVHNVSASYIMKCDDDTFVRVDGVLNELKMVNTSESLYLGNMNMYHRPLRTGKWAVSFEEWPDETYPTYANGAGYVISADIAKFVVAERRRKALELFKMEDVSMGLWVRQFEQAGGTRVQYVNTWKFYTAKCEDGYILAHYQSPRQMLCLRERLLQGDTHCCI